MNLKYIAKVIFVWVAVVAFSTIVGFKQCDGLQGLAFISPLQKVCSVIVSCITIVWAGMLYLRKKYMPSKVAILIIVMYGYIALVTLYNGYKPFRRGMLGLVFMTLCFDMILYSRDKVLFQSIVCALDFLIFLNFLSVIALHGQKGLIYYSSEGVRQYGNYLLGYDNGHIIMLLPVICFNLMIYMRTRKKRYLFLPLLAILEVGYTFSATSIMLLAFMALFYLIYRFIPKARKYVVNKNFLTASLIGMFFVFILMKGYKYLALPLRYVFHKDVESTREILFQTAMDYIKQKWLCGYGYVVDSKWIHGYNSGHNIFLNFMLSGGIIGLILFLSILYIVFQYGEKSLKVCRENIVLFCAVIAFIVADFTEGYDTYVSFYLFFWLCLALYNGEAMDELLEHYEKKELTE